MAFYTYKCSICGLEKEYQLKPSEVPLKKCECGAENPERVWCPNIAQNWLTGDRCGTTSYWDKNRKGLDK